MLTLCLHAVCLPNFTLTNRHASQVDQRLITGHRYEYVGLCVSVNPAVSLMYA